MNASSLLRKTGAAAAAALMTGPALAHAGHAEFSLVDLLSAPLAGADHLAAFLIVSLWCTMAVGTLVHALRRSLARRAAAA